MGLIACGGCERHSHCSKRSTRLSAWRVYGYQVRRRCGPVCLRRLEVLLPLRRDVSDASRWFIGGRAASGWSEGVGVGLERALARSRFDDDCFDDPLSKKIPPLLRSTIRPRRPLPNYPSHGHPSHQVPSSYSHTSSSSRTTQIPAAPNPPQEKATQHSYIHACTPTKGPYRTNTASFQQQSSLGEHGRTASTVKYRQYHQEGRA